MKETNAHSLSFLEALLSLPAMYGAQVARDGKWVAWTWFRAGPAADVYVAPTDGSRPPIRLTDSTENTYLVSWTPDSRGVIVEQDRGGDERARLFLVEITSPCKMLALTEEDPQFFIRGGELHRSGRWLVYGANHDVERGKEIEPTWIYRHDLKNGNRVVLARPQKAGYSVPRLQPQGEYVLYPRNDLHPSGVQFWLVEIEGKEDREILNFGRERKVEASWFPGGDRVLFLAEGDRYRRLGIWKLKDGSIRWLIDDPERNIEIAFVPFASDRVVVVEIKEARLRPSLLNWNDGIETPLETRGNLVPLAPVGDGYWIGEYYSSRHPQDIVVFPLEEPRPERFKSLARVWERTMLKPEDLREAENFHWCSSDGLSIQGWLYRARGQARGTIVYVHGGPTSHSEDRINLTIQFLVHEGFNVLDPNYRGSTGFGLDFQESIKEQGFGGKEQEDIRRGIEALLEAGIAEPGKVGITGTSYGGYSSWWAITHFPPEIIKAAAPICGMTDLVVDYETTRPDLRTYSEEMMGGSPVRAPERYRERSPVHFLRNIRGRLLVVQGQRDPNVTPENVRAVKGGLDEAGIPYELLEFADEGHGVSKPKNQKILLERLSSFFQRALAG